MGKKESISFCLFLIGLGCVLFVVGYIWSVYLCLLIGLFFILYNLLGICISLFDDDTIITIFFGIGLEILLSFLLFSELQPYKETRYITEQGKKQHIYIDCPTIINSNDVRKVCKLEGLVRFKCSDCKICKERELDEQENDEYYYED